MTVLDSSSKALVCNEYIKTGILSLFQATFVSWLTKVDPNSRPEAKQIFEHTFFTEKGPEKVKSIIMYDVTRCISVSLL